MSISKYSMTRIKRMMADGLLNKPFTIVPSQRSWGVVYVIKDAQNYSADWVNLNGDSKQRSQQKRALLRELNQ